MSDMTHPIVTKRHQPIGIFTVVAWAVGAILVIWAFIASRNPLQLLWIVPVFLVGVPIPDVGPPHTWVVREWRRRSQWRRDKGRMMAPALFGEPKGPPCDIERAQGILARVKIPGKPDAFVPIMTDETREYATIGLRLSGASPQWLQSDTSGKFNWDLAWFEGIAKALGITREPDMEIFFTHGHRPADVETMLRLARARYDEEVLAAAVTDPKSVNGRLGQNISDRIDRVYGIAGDPLEYVFLRTLWPRGWLGKIGVNDADAFKRSPLFRTISEIKGVYEQLGITAGLLLPREAQELWDEFFNVTDLPAIHRYRQQEQVLERRLANQAEAADNSEGDAEGDDKTDEIRQLEIQMTQSLRSGPPDQPGYLCYGGTYFLAGYAKVKVDSVKPSHRRSIVLDDDVFWALTVHVKAKLRDREAVKTREKERGLNMAEGLNPLKQGVTDPEGDQQWYDVVRKRMRLSSASNRVPHSNILLSVAGRSLKEAEARWEDVVVQFGSLYKVERMHYRDDIEDILLAQLGLRFDAL